MREEGSVFIPETETMTTTTTTTTMASVATEINLNFTIFTKNEVEVDCENGFQGKCSNNF